MIKIAINGFGRIGRQAFKIALERDDIEIVAVNDPSPAEVLAHLLTYDSVYGIYPKKIKVEVDGKIVAAEGLVDPNDHFSDYGDKEIFIIVNNKKVRVLRQLEPAKLPWRELNIDVVLECTGRFEENDAAMAHIHAGANKVILSAPAKGGETQTFLFGVNADKYDSQGLISNGSCTTNCVGPIMALMHSNFGIAKSMMTTIHAYTATQALVDGSSKSGDLRRMRAASVNIVPASTGSSVSVGEAIPEIKGKFDSMAFRVPVLSGSVSDFTFLLNKSTTVEEINDMFINAANNNPLYKDILRVTNEPIVSSDILGNTASAIVDLSLTKVVDGDMVKVVAWYDNEVGYSVRLVEMAVHVTSSK